MAEPPVPPTPGASEAPPAARQPDHAPAEALPPGWSRPKPEHAPRPTYWPAVMALGVTCLFWGVVTSYVISGVGLLLFVIALASWIGELSHGGSDGH